MSKFCIKCGVELKEYDPVLYDIQGRVAHAICPKDSGHCDNCGRLKLWAITAVNGAEMPNCPCIKEPADESR